jgi:hypothetical protein
MILNKIIKLNANYFKKSIVESYLITVLKDLDYQ